MSGFNNMFPSNFFPPSLSGLAPAGLPSLTQNQFGPLSISSQTSSHQPNSLAFLQQLSTNSPLINNLAFSNSYQQMLQQQAQQHLNLRNYQNQFNPGFLVSPHLEPIQNKLNEFNEHDANKNYLLKSNALKVNKQKFSEQKQANTEQQQPTTEFELINQKNLKKTLMNLSSISNSELEKTLIYQ